MRSKWTGIRAGLTAVGVALAAWMSGTGVMAQEPASAAASPGSRRLAEIVAEEWGRRLASEPDLRLREGLPVFELPGAGPAQVLREADQARRLLEQLGSLRESELTHEEALTLELMRWSARGGVEAAEFAWSMVPVTPYASPLRSWQRIFPGHQFAGAPDLDRYLDLVAQAPPALEGLQGVLRRQAARGIVLPKAEIDLVLPFLKGQLPQGSQGTFAVAEARLAAVGAEAAARFQAQLKLELDEQVRPSLDRLTAYLDGPYRQQAPEAVGQGQYPRGPDYYRWLVRQHTTMEVDPDEVHRIGLELVQGIDAEMAGIRKTLGYSGTKQEFHQFLKTDPRFFPKAPEEVRERLLGFQRKLMERVGTMFSVQPRAAWDVQRLDPALEGAMTFGFYQPPTAADPSGTYFFNGSKLSERNLLQAEALIYHELVPGHHFQIALQYENQSLPPLRQNYFSTAYTEGWGEYASSLGEELGGFQDPYDRYGRLGMEMFLAMRLVVDTGMNHLGWPRQKAIELMRENLLESDAQIATETLRYSCDIPGQALAYRMGARKIRELREKAASALGERFDLRDFHDAVLSTGNLPMAVLEKHVDWYIEQRKAALR